MSYQLSIVFTGVCAYIPNRPWDQLSGEDAPTELTVVMPDGRKGKACSAFAEHLRPHMPYMALPVVVQHNGNPETAYRIRELEGRRVELVLNELDAKNNSLRIDKLKTQDELGQSPTLDNGTNLGWLPSMNFHLPNHAEPIKQSTQFPIGAPLLAQVKIKFGSVMAHYTEDMEWTERLWSFRSPSDSAAQGRAYANQVEVRLTLNGPLQLKLYNATGQEVEALSLGPTASSGTLALVIGNLCGHMEEYPLETILGKTLCDVQYWLRMKSSTGSDFESVRIPVATKPKPNDPDDDLRLLYCLFKKRDELVAAHQVSSKVPTLVFEGIRSQIEPRGTRTAECYGGLLNP